MKKYPMILTGIQNYWKKRFLLKQTANMPSAICLHRLASFGGEHPKMALFPFNCPASPLYGEAQKNEEYSC